MDGSAGDRGQAPGRRRGQARACAASRDRSRAAAPAPLRGQPPLRRREAARCGRRERSAAAAHAARRRPDVQGTAGDARRRQVARGARDRRWPTPTRSTACCVASAIARSSAIRNTGRAGRTRAGDRGRRHAVGTFLEIEGDTDGIHAVATRSATVSRTTCSSRTWRVLRRRRGGGHGLPGGATVVARGRPGVPGLRLVAARRPGPSGQPAARLLDGVVEAGDRHQHVVEGRQYLVSLRRRRPLEPHQHRPALDSDHVEHGREV